MRRIHAFTLTLILVFCGLFVFMEIAPQPVNAYTPHDPIHISGNADFAAQAASEGWPGDGNEGNPYIIEGYEINATYGYEIRIELSDVHFVLRNSVFREQGIILNNVAHGTIDNCSIGENNVYGGNLDIYSSSNITIINNSIQGFWSGINIWESCNLIIEGNSLIGNGITIHGYDLVHWESHNITNSNTVNNKTVYYWKNKIGGTVPRDAGQVILANCSNVTVERVNISNVTSGIQMGFSSNNIIRDNRISENNDLFNYGIYVLNSTHNRIENNSIENKYHGISLDRNSSYNNITRNNVSESDIGISLNRISFENFVDNNYLYHNTEGISISYSYNGSVKNNILVNNGIMIEGDEVEHWNTHEISTTNTANGGSVYYYKNERGGTNPLDAGQIILANCTGMRIENQNIQHTSPGILLGFSSNNTITNNTLLRNGYGILIKRESNGNIISHNQVRYNYEGMHVSSSRDNQIISNNFISNDWTGLYISNSNNNFIRNNNANENRNGIEVSRSNKNNISANLASSNMWHGIQLRDCSENVVFNNIISYGDDVGIGLYNSRENEIVTNNINHNSFGIYSTHSHGNYFVDNQIVDNGNGLHLSDSNGTTVELNNVFSNNRGVSIQYSNGSVFKYNDITYNNEAFSIRYCNNNTIHHNNFDNYGWLHILDSNDTWHDENGNGNYWYNYTGIDTNDDGVGDTDLPHNGVDYHPLTEPNVVEEPEDYSEYGLWLFFTIVAATILIFIILTLVRRMKPREGKKGENEKPAQIDKKQKEVPVKQPENLNER